MIPGSTVLVVHLGWLTHEDAVIAWDHVDDFLETGNWPLRHGFHGSGVCTGPLYGLHLPHELLRSPHRDFLLAAAKTCQAEITCQDYAYRSAQREVEQLSSRAAGELRPITAEEPAVAAEVELLSSPAAGELRPDTLEEPVVPLLKASCKKVARPNQKKVVTFRGSAARCTAIARVAASKQKLVASEEPTAEASSSQASGSGGLAPPPTKFIADSVPVPAYMVAMRRSHSHATLREFLRKIRPAARAQWKKVMGQLDLPKHRYSTTTK